ncbi:MAG: hypothetical protein CVT86_03775, partial [Alphaproteobacteria bacterium HGW-Alphaproteobacteria-8]
MVNAEASLEVRMNRLNRIALAVLASFTLSLAAAPADADSRSDRRGGYGCCVKQSKKDMKRAEHAYR